MSLEDSRHLPHQRWQIHPAQPQQAAAIAQATGLLPWLAQVLINHELVTPEQVQGYLEPETLILPSPLEEFADLALSVELLEQAIAKQDKIAICGDYDADGMTSTALLLRALRALGAQVDYAIPSRMQEGYGINERIVEEFHTEGVRVILTVDNGIAALEPIARARELGLAVIVTDHHDLPPQLPDANAILNPKLLADSSVYASLAGVGVAYVLAVCLAQQLGRTHDLITPLLELCTLGTIADLAPLKGVNRRWVKRGLKLLPQSKFAGVQALIQVAGGNLTGTQQPLKPDAIGFRLGPRINAVGRIGDPQTVIELLTTDDSTVALERAMQCEQTNRERQQLCEQIEQAAIASIEESDWDVLQERVLVVVQPDWHHGVIGIVASRLVERYGVPVFIGTYESDRHIRGSARSIPEFDIFAALQSCSSVLERFGGHRAAGGFSLLAKNLPEMRSRLRDFAHQCLQPEHLKPLVTIDTEIDFEQITWELYHQIDRLQPCGMANPEPVFYTSGVRVVEQKVMGKSGTHLKLTLAQTSSQSSPSKVQLKATAWRWGGYFPLPRDLDVAYRLRENNWNGDTTLELELVGARVSQAPRKQTATKKAPSPAVTSLPLLAHLQAELICECPEPPVKDEIAMPPRWFPGSDLLDLLPQFQGNVLIYGDQRPYVSNAATVAEIEYDRPTRPCTVFVLWTLPPSITHLRWLLARGKPVEIYVHNQMPSLPTASELRTRLYMHLSKSPQQPLNLLAMGQESWVAPSTLIAALRELGYACTGFPNTCSLEQELQRLERWYRYSPQELAKLS
jgi:single-stranded-DNA-specific exonuclease